MTFGQKNMRAAIQLFTILPVVLRGAWALLLFGMILLAAGYFTQTPWQSYAGIGGLICGYVIAILDMIYRRRHRGDAAGFYVGATVAPIFALIILLFVGLLGAVVLAVQSIIYGFSGMHAMHLLHFVGLVFAFSIVIGIPALALRATPNDKTEQDA